MNIDAYKRAIVEILADAEPDEFGRPNDIAWHQARTVLDMMLNPDKFKPQNPLQQGQQPVQQEEQEDEPTIEQEQPQEGGVKHYVPPIVAEGYFSKAKIGPKQRRIRVGDSVTGHPGWARNQTRRGVVTEQMGTGAVISDIGRTISDMDVTIDREGPGRRSVTGSNPVDKSIGIVWEKAKIGPKRRDMRRGDVVTGSGTPGGTEVSGTVESVFGSGHARVRNNQDQSYYVHRDTAVIDREGPGRRSVTGSNPVKDLRMYYRYKEIRRTRTASGEYCYDTVLKKRVSCKQGNESTAPAAKLPDNFSPKPPRVSKPKKQSQAKKQPLQTVDSFVREIQHLKKLGTTVPVEDFLSVVNRMAASLKLADIQEVAKKLNVGGATGRTKSPLATKILEHALTGKDNKPEPTIHDPEAKKLAPLQDRVWRILQKERHAAPYIDMLLTKLKHDKLVKENLPDYVVFSDLKRWSEGLEPLNTNISVEKLDHSLADLEQDYGRLTPAELLTIMPLLKYQEHSKEGVESKETSVSQRKMPDSVLSLFWGPHKPDKQGNNQPSIPVSPHLPPLQDRLERIIKREQSGAAPFMDMVVEKLRQDNKIPQDFPPELLIQDMQRMNQGLPSLNSNIDLPELSNALKVLAPDFGKLTAVELLRLSPHLKYPGKETEGVTGKEIIRHRYIPVDVLEKMRS